MIFYTYVWRIFRHDDFIQIWYMYQLITSTSAVQFRYQNAAFAEVTAVGPH